MKFPRTGKRGAPQAFARKLFQILEEEETDTIAWNDIGDAFFIKNPEKFLEEVLMKHFRHDKFPSFQRQLNLYGFRKITRGPYTGAYAHQYFRRGQPELLDMVLRKSQTPSRSPVVTNQAPQASRHFNFDTVLTSMAGNEFARQNAHANLPHNSIPSLSPLSLGPYTTQSLQGKLSPHETVECMPSNISPILNKDSQAANHINPFLKLDGLNLKLDRANFPIGHNLIPEINQTMIPNTTNLYASALDISSYAPNHPGMPQPISVGLEALHPDYLKTLLTPQTSFTADPTVNDKIPTPSNLGPGERHILKRSSSTEALFQVFPTLPFTPSLPLSNCDTDSSLKYVEDPIHSLAKTSKPEIPTTVPLSASGSSDISLFGSLGELESLISDQKRKSEIGKKMLQETITRSSSKDWALASLMDSQFPQNNPI